MVNFYLNIQIAEEGAKPFKKSRRGDAAYDIWSLHDATIMPMSSQVLKTGIVTEFPEGWVALVLDRSGLGFKGTMKRAGCIDSNWRGPWEVCLFNSSSTPILIEGCLGNPDAKACAQVVFVPCADVEPRIVTKVSESNRGDAWQGSSDKKG